jgi:alginate O-acetyltransferase complex protein AlgI
MAGGTTFTRAPLMVFSSIIFLFCFLPLFFLIYFLADGRYKNGVILFGSIIFYAWDAPQFVFVLLGTTIADFIIVRNMAARKRVWQRRSLSSLRW